MSNAESFSASVAVAIFVVMGLGAFFFGMMDDSKKVKMVCNIVAIILIVIGIALLIYEFTTIKPVRH